MNQEAKAPAHFIRHIIRDDLEAGRHSAVMTRFPPEPNGFLHIGHAKSICLNFGMAEEFAGQCNLRFDDTNPEKEEQLYIDAIQDDVRWLGFKWHGDIRYASNYFQAIHDAAVELIQKGLAYVDHQDAEQIRLNRGTLKEPGKASPYRDRTVTENLALFAQMRNGDFAEGECILRAKIANRSRRITTAT